MRYRMVLRMAAGVVLLVSGFGAIGCSSTGESAGRDKLTANVGQYPPGPSGVDRPRVGVPPFKVSGEGSMFHGGGDLNDLAADQMTTLLDQTGRFDVIERAQLQKLINEQNLEGIVTPGELAKAGKVRGVDYLLLGRVTNLRVKRESTSKGFGLAQVGGLINAGAADVKQKDTAIKTECGVDIRLVDPTTGKLMTSNFSEYTRTDSASSMGVTILGANAQSSADIQLSEDDKGKILRLALDDAVRKSLPKIDKFLRSQPRKAEEGTPAGGGTPANGAAPANTGAAAPAAAGNAAVASNKFCPQCGTANVKDAKFCSKCGTKLD